MAPRVPIRWLLWKLELLEMTSDMGVVIGPWEQREELYEIFADVFFLRRERSSLWRVVKPTKNTNHDISYHQIFIKLQANPTEWFHNL